MRIKAVLIVMIVIVLGLVFPSFANPPALPPVPSASILQQVINQGAPTFTPLGVPDAAITALVAFGGVFNGVENRVDVNQAVSYLATGGTLKETVIPLTNSGSTSLTPNMTTPDGKRGKIIGAVYQPYRGSRATLVLVVVFKKSKPDKVRMYYTNTQFYEYSAKWGTFPSSVAGTYDEGALISHDLSCVTVGNKQVCWEPASYSGVREQPYPKDVIYDAYTRAKDTYDLNNDFFVDDAVPDLIGPNVRANCAAQLDSGGGSACDPNLYFSASKEANNDLMAIFVVDSPADLDAFTDEGTYVGSLPAGEYVVVNATPNVVTPGATG
ncbi:MAG: hypothetical protein H7Y11_13310, partial [Armatimonadetes bacterium]|nr:hypothetical protein [Anaerolineae bacterium]